MPTPSSHTSRRDFLKTSTVAAGALIGGLSLARNAHARDSDDMLRIGLIGCGGRGSGAAVDALSADKNVKLVAMGDLFADRIEDSLKNISSTEMSRRANEVGDEVNISERVDVSPDRRFSGFDAFQKVIDSGVDVVILATPPHFRPVHFQAAISAGKHCFVEKPVAVDAPGIRSVLAASEEAKKQSLAVVSGLCWRYDQGKRETISRIQDGAIGELQAMEVSYLTNTLKYFPRLPEWSDMEWQIRNWQYFTWMSGDHVVEQHVHSLDKAAWAMKDEPPVKCSAIGGRQMRDPNIGNTYDHFSTVFEYAGGQKLFSRCRQMDGCDRDEGEFFQGTSGSCVMNRSKNQIEGTTKWRFRGSSPPMYRQEHAELFASIRAGNPINNGLYMCNSTLMGIMARMSAYTGKDITWEQAMASQENLSPKEYSLTAAPPSSSIAKPGITQFV